MNKKKEQKIEEGKCPICGNKLIYGEFTLSDNNTGYWLVDCKNCGFAGREWYTMVFDCFTSDKDDNKEYHPERDN